MSISKVNGPPITHSSSSEISPKILQKISFGPDAFFSRYEKKGSLGPPHSFTVSFITPSTDNEEILLEMDGYFGKIWDSFQKNEPQLASQFTKIWAPTEEMPTLIQKWAIDNEKATEIKSSEESQYLEIPPGFEAIQEPSPSTINVVQDQFIQHVPRKQPSLEELHSYEFRIINEESSIQERLDRQMQFAKTQMQNEPEKSYRYKFAPMDWIGMPMDVKGYQAGISYSTGPRKQMKELNRVTSFYLTIAGRNYPVQFFGIFQGMHTKQACQFACRYSPKKIRDALIEFNPKKLTDKGIWNALKIAMVRLNEEFKEKEPQAAHSSGTTATIALILNQKIWAANLGDAKVVVNNDGTPIQLTEDALPEDPRYEKGIVKRGGYVAFNLGYKLNKAVPVARGIGYSRLNGALSARPKITSIALSAIQPGSHLVLYSRGIKHIASTKQIVETVHVGKHINPEIVSGKILYSSYRSGATENQTCIVVKL